MADALSSRKATIACASCRTLNRVDLERLEAGPRCGSCGNPLPLDQPIVVGDRDLERVVRDAEVPVLVDFYADWCGPCKIMAPLLDDLAKRGAGRLLVAKLDTDANPTMSGKYGIRGIPTLIAFRGGREVAREVGAVPKGRLDALVAQVGAGE